MNKEGHVLNAALLSIGLGVVLVPPTAFSPLAALETAEMMLRLSVPIVLGALFPDVDTAFGKHRKTLHNVFVLGVVAAYPVFFDNLQFVWIGVATHYFLDMVGSKRGIALFHPLSDTEYSLPTGVATSSAWATQVTILITVVELAVLGAIHYYAFALNTSLADATAAFGV
jgi:hypothetical protein